MKTTRILCFTSLLICLPRLIFYSTDFMLLTFGILSLTYRHQLIYIYSTENDKGGKLWPRMIMLLVVCMFISEVTLIGIMSIKVGLIAASLMVPLFVATVFFLFYIKQQHFRVTEFVPSTLCKDEDIKNHDTLDISFLHNKYLQPSMKVKTEYPYNYTGIMAPHNSTVEEIERGGGHWEFVTPLVHEDSSHWNITSH